MHWLSRQTLLAALNARPPAKHQFMAFAPSHRRNVLRWIASAKRAGTRTARVEKRLCSLLLGREFHSFDWFARLRTADLCDTASLGCAAPTARSTSQPYTVTVQHEL